MKAHVNPQSTQSILLQSISICGSQIIQKHTFEMVFVGLSLTGVTLPDPDPSSSSE